MSRGARRAAMLASLLIAALLGCRRETTPVRVEMPVAWLLDRQEPADAIGVAHGAQVTVAGERRRALASPQTFRATAAVVHQPVTSLEIDDLPADVRAWGRAAIERSVDTGGHRHLVGAVIGVPAGGPVRVPVPATERLAASVEVRLRSAVPVERYDVETEPVTIPADAVLAFGAAVLTVPGIVTTAEGRIDVVDDGGRHALWQRQHTQATAWQDVRVPLDAWAGRAVRFRFSSRSPSAATAGTVVVFGDPVVLAPHAAPARPLRVLLISMDTLRAQSVGAYGAARPTTPAIDALAADGVLFENAYSTAAYTMPGHTSMVTGLWLRTHGVLTRGNALAPDRHAVSELLQAAGWATGGFSSSAIWLRDESGFHGYDAYVEEEPPYWRPPAALPYSGFTRGLAWLSAQGERPVFAFLHNYQVHAPYLPARDYDGCFGESSNEETVEDHRLRYEEEVRYADDQVRAVLDAVDWLGLRDRTLVVLTADHGEAFAEHGRVEHTYDVHDEVARVPLIMRLPGTLPAGRRIAEPVSLADVAPTILDVAGAPTIADADGVSLLPLIDGVVRHLDRPGVFTEAESEPHVGWTDVTAIHTRTHTCIRYARAAVDECYDVRADPWQHRPPLDDAANPPGLVEARAALTAFLARPPATAAPDPGISPDVRQELRALGYVE